jgi:hypothetical protein
MNFKKKKASYTMKFFVLFKASYHEVKHYNMKIKTIKKSSLIYWSNVFCKLFKIVDRSKIKDKETVFYANHFKLAICKH